MEQVLYEVKRVVVGQDYFLERVMIARAGPGPPAGGGRARPCKDADRQDPGAPRCAAVSSASSSRPTWCRPTWWAPASTSPKTGEFATSLGPVFTNLLLADEINRAPAKVQSALLEVMQERQVTIAGDQRTRCLRALSGDGHPEPDRDRRHLPAARGAGGPLHDEGAGGLPERGRRVRHCPARDRNTRHHRGRGGQHGPAGRAAGRNAARSMWTHR